MAGTPTRAKGDGTCALMTANIALREAWWDHHPLSEGFGETAHPYLDC